MPRRTLTLNGEVVILPEDLEPRTSLAEYLRASGLRSVHVSCEQAVCGVCTVLMNGQPVKSCVVLAVQAIGSEILTVECGDRMLPELPLLQRAFHARHALQCGFCTPAMLLSGVAYLRTERPTEDPRKVREAISGTLCRCTGYEPIVEAIHEVATRAEAGDE